MPIAVVRAETYYVPPRNMPPDVWKDVPGAELVFRWVEHQMGRRVTPPDSTLEGVPLVYARVNQNRWLADCVCRSAAIISPSDPRWACTQCGYGWAAMVVPTAEEVAAIEAELMAIPMPHLRNWWNPADPDPMNPSRPPEVPDPGPGEGPPPIEELAP